MNLEKLIEEVRKFLALYDQSNEKYRNIEYKDRIWRQIGSISPIEGTADDCKKKWGSVRDQLRRTLNKRKTKSGQAAGNIRKYKYEDILSFLVPYLGERESLSNVSRVDEEENDEFLFGADLEGIPTAESHEDKNSNIFDVQQNSEKEKTPTNPSYSKDTSVRLRDITSVSTSQVPAKNNNFVTPSASAKKRKILRVGKTKSLDFPTSPLMAFILSEKEKEKEAAKQKTQTSPCKEEPVDAFLCGITPALKSLNLMLLHEAKGKIFSNVQELELKQLQINQGYWNSMNSPHTSSSGSAVSELPKTPATPENNDIMSPFFEVINL